MSGRPARARGYLRVVSIAASFACALIIAPAALAAKPQATAASLTLTSQSTSLNRYNPPWCMSEDDYHQRTWIGSLAGSFRATEYLCNSAVDYYSGMWWNAGGIGVQADVYANGTVSGLTITSPQGDSHSGVLVGSSTSKGVTTYHYQVCYMPPVSVTYDNVGKPLSGGTWTVTLSGSLKSASYSVMSIMGYLNWQQQYCPSSEQNLTP